jgi:hypothetical protein
MTTTEARTSTWAWDWGPSPGKTLWAWLENRKTPVTATFEPHTEEDFLATEAYAACPLPIFGHTPRIPV